MSDRTIVMALKENSELKVEAEILLRRRLLAMLNEGLSVSVICQRLGLKGVTKKSLWERAQEPV